MFIGFLLWKAQTSEPQMAPPEQPFADLDPAPKPEKKYPPEPDPGDLAAPRTPEKNAPASGVGRRYDFYRILRDYEVVIPEAETTHPRVAKPQSDARAERPQTGVYLLQVGSFRTLAQAQTLRAELALLGLEAVIKAAPTPKGQTWRRVQVGPYRDAAERNGVIENLEANGYRPILVRLQP